MNREIPHGLLVPTIPNQDEVMSDWSSDTHPLLSIACTTYNHVNFIELSLRGFLIQRTTFPFEIVVHDDASTDGTTQILNQYRELYPKIIRLVVQEQNQYSRGQKPFAYIYPELRGQYIAICEGDDYWTDPKKLEKQVTFLERNPEYVISGHDACVIDEKGNVIRQFKLAKSSRRDYSGLEMQTGIADILSLSRVFRRVLKDDEALAERSLVKNGDSFLISLLGQHGASHFHFDIEPAVYRVHPGGVWSVLSRKSRAQAQATTWLLISNYYQRIGETDLANIWYERFKYRQMYLLSSAYLFRELLIRVSLIRLVKKVLINIRIKLEN